MCMNNSFKEFGKPFTKTDLAFVDIVYRGTADKDDERFFGEGW